MKIEEAYNIWADQYDSNKNKTRDLDQKVTKEVLEKYAFESVIELGSGTGKNTIFLAQKAKKVECYDFSIKMLQVAKNKIKSPRVRFSIFDINDKWDIANQFADLITASLVLEHIENFDPIFKQASVKLVQNGIFFICELHPFKQYVGSKARFDTAAGTQTLQVFTHHISDYLTNAENNGFQLLELKEWFDEDLEYDIPRLISFVFKKL